MGEMKMRMGAAFLLVVLLISSEIAVVVHSDASDCYDACTTACVLSNSRLQQRCERKCEIKCGPDVVAEEGLVGG